MNSGNIHKILVFNSRQSLRPIGSDAWIVNTGRAVRYAAELNATVLTSTGMSSWEMAVYFASGFKVRQVIFAPLEPGTNVEIVKAGIINQFRLDDRLIAWRFLDIASGAKGKDQFRHMRDKMILNEADIIYPVAIRPGGNLERALMQATSGGRKLDNRFKVKFEAAPRPCKTVIDKSKINPQIDTALSGFLIHWTRSSNSCWPGETLYDYYDSIANSTQLYPRTAISTLLRILEVKCLRSSSRHYRAGIQAVPFSALLPSQAADLMRWRARYQEMTFEPYGLAISSDFAEKLGIRKVFYGNSEMHQYLEECDKPYFQNIGTTGFWMPEKEFRYIGDIDLSGIPVDSLKIIVREPKEIRQARQLFSGEIVSFYG